MNFCKLHQLGTALAFACAASAANAVPYNIDGSFADWQINSHTLKSSTARKETIEDQHDSYLIPGYGGQTYDAEAIYLDWDANFLYVGVLTGMPKTQLHNPARNSWGPGDIILDFGRDKHPEYAFKVISRDGLTSGRLYQGTTWDYGLWYQPNILATNLHPSTDVVGVKTGNQIATGNLAYSSIGSKNLGDWVLDTHYFIEAKIPTSAFGNLWRGDGPKVSLDVSWAAMCGNDIIVVDPAPVSEPAMGGLITLMLGSLAWHRRKQKK